MTIVDASTRNGSPLRSEAPEPALLAQPCISHIRGAPGPSRAAQDVLESSDHPGLAAAARHGRWSSRSTHAAPTIDDARRSAVHFFWAWLLLVTGVSIAGNFLHSWLTAPPAMRTWAAAAAIVTPVILLGATHSVALLIKTRRRDGWTLVDVILLVAALLQTIAVAACAFTLSFFSLRDLMVTLVLTRWEQSSGRSQWTCRSSTRRWHC